MKRLTNKAFTEYLAMKEDDAIIGLAQCGGGCPIANAYKELNDEVRYTWANGFGIFVNGKEYNEQPEQPITQKMRRFMLNVDRKGYAFQITAREARIIWGWRAR